MNSKWTPEMDAELTRRRKEGQSFGQIAVAMKLPKNAAIGRAKRIGLDPTDYSSSERFYVMQRVKHTARKTFAEKRVQPVEPPPPPEPPKPFRSPVQDEWPLTMCAELPLSLDREYEAVN